MHEYCHVAIFSRNYVITPSSPCRNTSPLYLSFFQQEEAEKNESRMKTLIFIIDVPFQTFNAFPLKKSSSPLPFLKTHLNLLKGQDYRKENGWVL